jgi:hypothetical protein
VALMRSLILLIVPTLLVALQPEKTPDYFRDSREQIEVTNRVLAQPNGHPVTVLDLAKKMEVMFRRQFPEFADSVQARYQFYNMAWRSTLDDVINNELMLADAEDRNVDIPDSDIRRQMQEMFGPNVVETIDTLGLTHEEAWELVKTDLIVEQMRGAFVMSKAFSGLTPERIREEYEKLAEKAASDEEYRYKVLTIRHKKRAKGELAAERAHQLIEEQPLPDLAAVKEQLESEAEEADFARIRVTLADGEQRPLSSLAAGHREALTGLAPSECSAPIPQFSRADNSTVFRIFYLEDHVTPEPPSLADLEMKIQNELIQQFSADEYGKYVAKLRGRFTIDDEMLAQSIPQDFEPFSLH